MNITISGSIGFKTQGNQYESIEASSVISLTDDISEEDFSKLEDKVRNLLEKNSIENFKSALRIYYKKLNKIKNLIKTEDETF